MITTSTQQFTLHKDSAFSPQLKIIPANLTFFSKYLRPDENLKVELKDLDLQSERFVLSVLCGYQRNYPLRRIEINKNNKFYQMESVPISESQFKPRFFLSLQLTNRCNFYCKHCYNQLKNKHAKQTDLTLSVIDQMCRQFLCIERAREFPYVSIYLLGGEPLLYAELPELIEMLSRLKVKGVYFNDVRLGSNGLLVPKNIDLLKRARDLFDNFSVQISIDGDKKIYPYIRGRDIDIPLRALDILNKNNIKKQIGFTVSRLNRFCVEYILALCEQYNAYPHITPYVPFNEDIEVLTRSEWETFKLYLTGRLDKWYFGACGYDSGCGIGWNGTCVDPEGYIIGCPRDPEILGHIEHIPLDDKKLWRNKDQGPLSFYQRCGRFMKKDTKA